MKNPWTSKNPFMSLWLSGANKIANAGRGQATAAVKRETQGAVKQGTRNWFDFWSGGMKALAAAAAPVVAVPAPAKSATAPAAAPGERKVAAKAARKTTARKSTRKPTRKTTVRKGR